MNEHHTETRIIARIAGQIASAEQYGDSDQVAELKAQLFETQDKLVARGISWDSIYLAEANPIW